MVLGTPFVVVGGNIATGKSTLLVALGKVLNASTFAERWEDNPWFGSKPDHALASQLWFLVSAATDNQRISGGLGGIQERCIHEHALVFAADALSDDDACLLDAAYSSFDALLPSPDLLVFLHASPEELERRVRRRGRRQETCLTLERLIKLDTRYRELIGEWTRCPVIRIDTERLDLRVSQNVVDITHLVKEKLV